MHTRRMRAEGARLRGIGLAAITAVVSGFAVWVNGFGVRAWREAGASTVTYTTAKNLVAAALLLGIAAGAFRSSDTSLPTRPSTRRQWLTLIGVGIVGGSVPFLLFFEGLSRATSTQAAFIHKTLVVWVALLAVPLLKERLGALHMGAIGVLVAGQIALLGGLTDVAFGSGEVMILVATLLWSVEVIVAKRLLAEVAPMTVARARMGFGAVILVAYAVVSGGLAGLGSLGMSELGWIALTGLTLTAYVATWFHALARAQAVDVTAVLVMGAVITAALRTGFNGAVMPSTLGVLLVFAGVAAFFIPRQRPTTT